jgi:single-strand DNA-binding protein
MIKMQIIGNLGKDAEVRQVNGKNVIGFNVAHTEKYKDAQGVQISKTTWVTCSYWTDRTAVAPYLLKGKTVFVEGTPSVDTYVNQQNETVGVLRLNVRELQLVGGTPGENNGNLSGNTINANASNNPAPINTATPSAPSMNDNAIVDGNDGMPF